MNADSQITADPDDAGEKANRREEERRELRGYLIGFALSLALTVLAFGLVYAGALSQTMLLAATGLCAVVQIGVQLRYFLQIEGRQKREDLQLILFSALLLIIMVSGTIWIMASLALRMGGGMSMSGAG